MLTENKIVSFPYDHELSVAASLLMEDEKNIPDNVISVLKYCCDKSIGFILSRNTKAMSCKDARSKRSRLGHIGIPLCNELKSIVFRGFNKNNQESIIMAHCRGNCEIDVCSLMDACNLEQSPEIMAESDLQEQYGMVFGIVNPFLAESRWSGRFIHAFDEDISRATSMPPGTMMTNAGDHTWAIEFDPSLMVSVFNSPIVSRITKISDVEATTVDSGFQFDSMSETKHIGIITGNGPDSGKALWSEINKKFVEYYGNNFMGDISLPKVTVISIPAMGLSMELDKREGAVWLALSEAIQQLRSVNVDILVLACHTTHYFTEKIRSLFEFDGKKFISIAEATIEHIKEKQLNDIAVLGISFVADLNSYSIYKDLNALTIEDISEKTMRRFHELGYEVKKMRNNHTAFQKFNSLLKKEIKAKNVVIALTELSILWMNRKDSWQPNKEIIDPLDVYAKRIVFEYFKEGL